MKTTPEVLRPAIRPRRRGAARRGVGRFAAALLLAFGLGPAQEAQEAPAAPAAPSFRDQISVSLVLVPVVVRRAGGYVQDLERDRFRLFVDDRPVPIELFDQDREASIGLLILQDLSGSMGNGGQLEASREAVRFFLDRARSGDQLAIATFAGKGSTVEVPFTSDRQAVEEAIERWEAYGKTALHDAVARLPELSGDDPLVKRAALLITDGADNASQLSPAAARDIVRRAQVPVYVIGLGTGDVASLGRSGGKLYRYADVLNLLARYTGGEYFAVDDAVGLKEAVLAIADDLRSQYVLGFSAGGGRVKDRDLRVEVDGRRLKVLSRQGYRGHRPLVRDPSD